MGEIVLKLDITVDLDDALNGAFGVLKLVKPEWKDNEDVSSKIFDNGITNKMFGFFLKGDDSSIILVRVNGKGTELFLERAEEVKSFELLHKYGCAPSLYCIFNNGLCYEYIQGVTLTKQTVSTPPVYKALSFELARMHSIPANEEFPRQAKLFHTMRKFLHIAFESNATAEISDSLHNKQEKVLQNEVDTLEVHLQALNSPVVFCHNDLLLHNVIHNVKTGVVKFIDYEYAGFNYQAYDIGNHFCEFAGIEEVDYNLYPKKKLQLDWLQCYITALHERNHPGQNLEQKELNERVEVLYKQVNKFALASHLFWGIWSLVQARFSKLDFDYKEYSQLRLGEYYKKKEEMLAL